jgi:uncharacterized RDD family membrane protein YckC
MRMKAWTLDVFLGFLVISVSVQLFWGAFQGYGVREGAGGLLVLAAMFAYWVLIPFFWQGRTLGKLAFGLRMLDRSSKPLRVGQLIKRCLFYFMTILDTMAGLKVDVGESGALLHDRKCNTIVVSSRRDS